jgi:hypothetical protein
MEIRKFKRKVATRLILDVSITAPHGVSNRAVGRAVKSDDRERGPQLDRIYAYVAMVILGGGWSASQFVTPESALGLGNGRVSSRQLYLSPLPWFLSAWEDQSMHDEPLEGRQELNRDQASGGWTFNELTNGTEPP